MVREGRSASVRWGATSATLAALLLLTAALRADDTAVRARGGGVDGDDATSLDSSGGRAGAPRRSLTSQYTGPAGNRPIAHQGASGRRTIISQANVGALATEFKTVLTFSLPLVGKKVGGGGGGGEGGVHARVLQLWSMFARVLLEFKPTCMLVRRVPSPLSLSPSYSRSLSLFSFSPGASLLKKSAKNKGAQ